MDSQFSLARTSHPPTTNPLQARTRSACVPANGYPQTGIARRYVLQRAVVVVLHIRCHWPCFTAARGVHPTFPSQMVPSRRALFWACGSCFLNPDHGCQSRNKIVLTTASRSGKVTVTLEAQRRPTAKGTSKEARGRESRRSRGRHSSLLL